MAANMDAILRITTRGDASGLNSVAQGLGRITSGAQQSRQAIDRLTTGLSSATAGFGVGLLGKSFLDAGIAADMNTRRVQALAGAYGEIKQVGDVASQAAKQFGLSTVDASNAVADLYGRLRPTGITLSEIQTIFFGVNKAAMTLGMSTLDVSETMRQLSQSLGSGKLQGDELRSIMERMPAVGQAVAKVMGVTVGEIKGLGAAGAITTEVLIKAAAELNKLVPPPPTAMQRFTAAIEDLRTEIGVQLLPIITPFVEGLTKALKAASDLPGPLKAAAVAFGTFGVGILAAATAMQALSFASATFAAIKGGPVMAILAGGVGAGIGALAMADALLKAKQAQEDLNTATTQGGTAASQAAGKEREKSLAISEASENAGRLKQQQEAFNAAIDQSNAEYKLLGATIDATSQAIQRQGGLRDATLNADIAVNNAAKSILEYKLGQAKTDADKIPILIEIKNIELQNARLQKEALDAQIRQETEIINLKRQKAWQELRSAQAALATAAAYGQKTEGLQEQVNLMKVAANSADTEYRFQQKIADQKSRGAQATYDAQRQVIGFGINELRNQAANLPTGQFVNGAPVLSDGRTGMRVNGVMTYAGGGYTGSAPRSGGLDGQGGFMAMLHPRETVVDHMKTGAGGGVPNITIQTGQVLQMPDGSQWVSMADLEQAMQATAAGVLGQLRTPAGRIAMGGA
jgi:tape measure domain-containing protein